MMSTRGDTDESRGIRRDAVALHQPAGQHLAYDTREAIHMSVLDQVETIVVLLMENRSFDHMLGYLALPPFNRKLNGLQGHLDFVNLYRGNQYRPFHLIDPRTTIDPPHDRDSIALQLGVPSCGPYPMDGFVESYGQVADIPPQGSPAVMGYYTAPDVAMTHFLATSYAVCDRWHAPIPTGTQPNRLMAMAGESKVDDDVHILPDQALVYDWLSANNIRWRVYHEWLPFFTLMPRWVPPILKDHDHFRSAARLCFDVQEESGASFPQVIFVEPRYTNAPPDLGEANDDHPPTSISRGQEFLHAIYLALVSNPKRWRQTAFIVTYDEHGGFFDHVSPLMHITEPPAGVEYGPFLATGPRVPAIIVSPLVEPGSIYGEPLDHTSILKLLGDKFGGGSYSPTVEARCVRSAAEVLTRSAPRSDIPAPPRMRGFLPPITDNAVAFQRAVDQMFKEHAADAAEKFPALWHADDKDPARA